MKDSYVYAKSNQYKRDSAGTDFDPISLGRTVEPNNGNEKGLPKETTYDRDGAYWMESLKYYEKVANNLLKEMEIFI